MTEHDVRWTVFGRPIKPVSLALLISMSVIAFINLGDTAGALLDGWGQKVVGASALVAAVTLIGGWITQKPSLVRLGLLVTTGVWATRAVFVLLTQGIFFYGVWLNTAWVVLAGGTYLIESSATRQTQDRDES